jgi:RNA polymerase sigma factor (TIGR02999 family)
MGSGHDLPSATDPSPSLAPVGVLFERLYAAMRTIAERMMACEPVGGDLQSTAVVHEVFLRLVASDRDRVMQRGLFYHAAAEEMRRVLIDNARARRALRRGGGLRREVSSALDLLEAPTHSTTIELDDAISELGKTAPDAAAVVRLRFYAGLTVDETAEALDCSPRSVDRDWAYARAWLYDRLRNP